MLENKGHDCEKLYSPLLNNLASNTQDIEFVKQNIEKQTRYFSKNYDENSLRIVIFVLFENGLLGFDFYLKLITHWCRFSPSYPFEEYTSEKYHKSVARILKATLPDNPTLLNYLSQNLKFREQFMRECHKCLMAEDFYWLTGVVLFQ